MAAGAVSRLVRRDKEIGTEMTNMRATYRLQLNKDFTFAHALSLVPYLSALGISHVYLSPILKARPGSTHGYDTVDHSVINPELGNIDDFRALATALRAKEIGVVLDFVPNHMGVGGAHNPLWLDVLKHGQASRYADWFDIDWNPPRAGMQGKLLVPFLGASYATALANGDIELRHDADGFAVWAYDAEKLPIRSEDEHALLERYGDATAAIAAHAGRADVAHSWAPLDALIANQHWRLAHHLVAADEINYRRFFVNSDLAGIQIHRPDVFEHAHKLIFSLVAEGLVDGLRMDHVDGLRDPKAYLEQERAHVPRPIYLLVEKILAPHEPLPRGWPVDGTTGYEVGAQLTRVLVNPASETALTQTYSDFVGPTVSPHIEAYQCKLRVMDNELAAELGALGRLLAAVAWSVPTTRDLTEHGLRKAIQQVIAHLEIYRTYRDANGISVRDARDLRLAVARARRSSSHFTPALFDFLEALLIGTLSPAYDRILADTAVARFQQYTGPVMAKGLEDTALYRYNRLVALNEVGAHPDRFSISIDAFHDANRRRLAHHPDSMVTTSTHDTKRGEDTRAFIAAISDAPEVWDHAVTAWRRALGEIARSIHANDLYLFFQLLHGGWPIGAANAGNMAERLIATMVKSVREGRERSDWGVPDQDYEARLEAFVEAALAHEDFLQQFHLHRAPLVEIGRHKALVQLVLKLTIPGVPDIYRGAEDWEQSFVDPDNRRPVDFNGLAERLRHPRPGVDDKLVITSALLNLRRAKPDLFARGSYDPVDAGKSILAFRRALGEQEMIVTVALTAGSNPSQPNGTDWRGHLPAGPATVFTRG